MTTPLRVNTISLPSGEIAAELSLTETTVSDHLRRAGVTMRRSGPPAHPASTDQIAELRDQIAVLRDRGVTWNEVAEQVNMTVSGASTDNRCLTSRACWLREAANSGSRRTRAMACARAWMSPGA